MGSGLEQVVYLSRSVPDLPESELRTIQESARRNNERDRVSGLLIYDGSRFLHLLEGPGETLSATVERIRNDRRHGEMTVLIRRPIEARTIHEWSMGVVNLARRSRKARAMLAVLSSIADRCASAASEDEANHAVQDLVATFAYETPHSRHEAA